MSEKLCAAVLAAGSIPPDLARETEAEAKALIHVGGRPIINRVLEAVQSSAFVGDVRVVCAEASPLLECVGPLGVASRGTTFVDSIRTGLEALGSPDRLLLVTGDSPFLTAEALDHFCGQALQSDADLVYAIVNKGSWRGAAPLRRCSYGLGNLALASAEFIKERADRLAQAYCVRNNPLRLAAMLGWKVVLQLALGRLILDDVVARGERLLATRLHVVLSPYPEVAFDVDCRSNLMAAESWGVRSGRG